MSLKNLTWEKHKEAERKDFVKILLSGKITPKLYYRYLVNQYNNYSVLEAEGINHLPTSLRDIARSPNMLRDLKELEELYGLEYEPELVTKTTCEYVDYIYNMQKDHNTKGFIAHMYVRHFGDMYGGSIIRKRIPGSGTMYDFQDKERLKTEMRSLLDDSMAHEANRCFDFAISLFEELYNESDMVKTDNTQIKD